LRTSNKLMAVRTSELWVWVCPKNRFLSRKSIDSHY